jgi:hypothetical protein
MPSEMQMALRHRDTDIRVDYNLPSYRTFGLFEFLTHQPMYSRILYQLYKFARITAVNVKMEVVNTGSTAVTASMCVLPWIDTPAGGGPVLDPQDAAEYPRSITKQVGNSTGMSKATLQRTWPAFDQLGQPVYSPDFWVTATQAASSTPVNPDQPVVYCVIDATDGTLNWSANVSYTLTFHVQWFNLERDTLDELEDVVSIVSKHPVSMAKRK